MADCRSLIEFLRAFEHRRRRASSLSSDPAFPSSPRPRRASLSSSRSWDGLFTSLCDHSPLAAADALVLLSSLAALAFLATPYARLLEVEAREAMATLRPAASCVPLTAGLAAGPAVLAWDAAAHRTRWCGRPWSSTSSWRRRSACAGCYRQAELGPQLRGRWSSGTRTASSRRCLGRWRRPTAEPCSSSARRAGAPRGGWRCGALRRCAGSRSRETNTPKASASPMARRYE